MTSHDTRSAMPSVSVVVPLFNEHVVVGELFDRLQSALAACASSFEVVFVNDGSTDGTEQVLDELVGRFEQARAIHLARNFGQQAAVYAGLHYVACETVVVMDGDLQDDPAAIPAFVAKWREGYDVVFATRVARKESAVRRLLFHAFHTLFSSASSVALPAHAGNFGLMDARISDQVRQFSEVDRYFPGLRGWVGSKQIGVPVERAKRYDEQPRVSFLGLFRLAKTAIFSFSTLPLTLFYALALLCLATFGALALFVGYHKLVTGLAISGWASVVLVGSFFGAMNAFGVAVLGEYVIRIYNQVRSRPAFIVAREVHGRACAHEESVRLSSADGLTQDLPTVDD